VERSALDCLPIATPEVSAQAWYKTEDVRVFAAASLKNALDAVASGWQKAAGKTVKLSYAASSALARQIEDDAPAQRLLRENASIAIAHGRSWIFPAGATDWTVVLKLFLTGLVYECAE
jgi:Bacterial extracellular solute-binding protein